MGINEDLTDRHVIIVEDIVDTGLTMKQMVESLGTRHPASVEICSLLVKPDKIQEALDIKYTVMEIFRGDIHSDFISQTVLRFTGSGSLPWVYFFTIKRSDGGDT